MHKNNDHAARKWILISLGSAFFILDLVFTWMFYQNGKLLSEVEELPLTQSFLAHQENLSHFRNPVFFRMIAERQQYYPHDPAAVGQLYRLALLGGPADHATFASYASYLGSRECCKDQALRAWDESVRLCPTYGKVRLVAASGYLTLGEKQKAMGHLLAAIQLDASLAQRVYELGEKTGLRLPELIAITPSTPAAMMQLSQYLMSKGEKGAVLRRVLENLGKMPLSGQQRVDLIRYALNAEQYDIAANQATVASAREDTRAEGFAFLAEIAWRKNEVTQFEYFASQAEKSYMDQGQTDHAAKFALEAASRLISGQDTATASRRLESLLHRYPRYAPAFYQMSVIQQNHPETQLYYLEKAAALDPAAYQKELAAVYLRAGKFSEAEEIYRRLVAVPENQVDAYLGWARCRIAQGNLLGAMDILKTAIDRTGAPALILQLAETYDSFGDYQNAALTYQTYARSEPEHLDGYLRAAEVYMKIAQYWKAHEQYAKILERDPNNAEAKSKLSYLESIGY